MALLARPNEGPQPEDYNRPLVMGLSESLHCANFADRLCVLLVHCKSDILSFRFEISNHGMNETMKGELRNL